MGCMKCCSCLCKCLLVCTNIFAMIIGTVILLVGALLTFALRLLLTSPLASQIDSMTSSITSSLKDNLNVDIDITTLLSNISDVTGSLGWSFMILGIVVIVLSCIGCCGACCTVKCCLIVYAVIVGVILLAQVAVVAIWFSSNNMFKASAKTAMEDSVKEFTGISSKNIQSLLQNLIQIFVGCCGVDNGTDFQTMSPNWNRTYTISQSGYNYTFNLTYPLSCCKFNLSNFQPLDTYCPYNNTTPATSNYQTGCYNQMFDTYFQLNYLFYGLGGVLGFQCLLIVGAAIMIVADRKNKVKPT